MQVRLGIWGDIRVGDCLRSVTGIDWRVAQERDGWVQLVNRAGETTALRRPSDTAKVTLLEPTLTEALGELARQGLLPAGVDTARLVH